MQPVLEAKRTRSGAESWCQLRAVFTRVIFPTILPAMLTGFALAFCAGDRRIRLRIRFYRQQYTDDFRNHTLFMILSGTIRLRRCHYRHRAVCDVAVFVLLFCRLMLCRHGRAAGKEEKNNEHYHYFISHTASKPTCRAEPMITPAATLERLVTRHADTDRIRSDSVFVRWRRVFCQPPDSRRVSEAIVQT